MKIAQIVASLEFRHGGPSRSVVGLAAGLANAGNHVDLLATGPDETVADRHPDSLRIRAFRRDWPPALSCSRQLRRHLETISYDVLHHHGLWLRTLHYAHSASRRDQTPLVISPRGMMSPWAWNHRRWRKKIAGRCIHPAALTEVAGWHATASAEADDIRRLGFQQPICIAPNAVALPSTETIAAETRYWRERLPSSDSSRFALFHSRFHSMKRVRELIDLWLACPRPDWVLLLVGIPEEYSVAQLQAAIDQGGGTGRILVYDGTGTPPPYALASLFLLPSRSENFGLVVAEALARAVPVVTTDACPWDTLNTSGAGWCVPWEKFAANLGLALSESPSELQSRGQTGRALIKRDFNWNDSARRLLEFYATLPTHAGV